MSQNISQDSNGTKKSTIAEIMEIFKDHPSIIKWVKNLIIFFVGFQVVVFLVVVLTMMKISGMMDSGHSQFEIMKKEFDNHFESFEKKFDDEKARRKRNLERKIASTEQRINDTKKFMDKYKDFHSEGMELMRRNREKSEIEFFKRRGDTERVNRIIEEQERREREKTEKEEAEKEKNRLQVEKEEYLLKGLQEALEVEDNQSNPLETSQVYSNSDDNMSD